MTASRAWRGGGGGERKGEVKEVEEDDREVHGVFLAADNWVLVL